MVALTDRLACAGNAPAASHRVTSPSTEEDTIGTLTLPSPIGTIRIVDEPGYAFGSADNVRDYPNEIDLESGHDRLTSIHGVSIDDVPAVVVGAGGGCTRVHARSALILWDRLYLAVGHRVACFTLSPFGLERSIAADHATCFGLHYSPDHDALVCHGELDITRLRRNLDIAWCGGGRDIFTGDFRLEPSFIEAYDWDGTQYRFDYETGACPAGLHAAASDPKGR